MAVDAAVKIIDEKNIDVRKLAGIICSTGTPEEITPSMSCRILDELSRRYASPDSEHSGESSDELEMPAFDISAACSGYLYGLQLAYDKLLAGDRSSPFC
ncbi:hypothetical protein [Salinispira pacifica]|uniref:hypothetical protein n=1 Tax=Salinispira pacifica TaxID=1307761 RepID=UPI000418E96A|nr:hypothetical protein [Salinispira pacifica]